MTTETTKDSVDKPKFDWELGMNSIRDGWLVVYSAHLYYHGVNDEQSPLSDSSFDSLKNIVLINWNLLDKRVKEILISKEEAKASTFYIDLTRLQIYLARKFIYGD